MLQAKVDVKKRVGEVNMKQCFGELNSLHEHFGKVLIIKI